jgi:hexulose-6-phosphate isomerase
VTRIGIIQGRLLPPVNGKIQAFPRENWEEDFRLAAAAQLDCIEWIYDSHSEGVNPVGTDSGIVRMNEVIAHCGVAVHALCADYFMDKPLVRGAQGERKRRLDKLEWLLCQCSKVRIERIVLPFVDESAITTPAEEKALAECLRRVLPVAERLGVELHLEAALSPEALQMFLARVPHPLLKVNYDSGNSASLGYRPQDEFAAYGERIGSVHIKDRKRGGGTVPLGTGDTDFPATFSGLRALDYTGDFILQVARGITGNEVAWAKRNRSFVETCWSRPADGLASL